MDNDYRSWDIETANKNSTNSMKAARAAAPQRSLITQVDWNAGIPRTKGTHVQDYRHPEHITPIVTLAELLEKGKKDFGKSLMKASVKKGATQRRYLPPESWERTAKDFTTAQPDFIDPLYTSEYFPNHTTKDDGGHVTVKEDNIYNGSVLGFTTMVWDPTTNHFHTSAQFPRPVREVDFAWFGYHSYFYDGDLYLYPLSEASFIEGIAALGYFYISGHNLVEGVMPGCINVYDYVTPVSSV